MLTYEQRLLRQSGLGASEIASVMGLNDFETPLALYLRKTTPLPEIDPLANNEAVIMGNLLEPVIAARYEQLMNETLLPCDTMHHPLYPYILATPDRLIQGKNKGVEIKTAGIHALDKWKNNNIPKSYLLQCHQCMLVTGLTQWDLVVLFGGQELKIFPIEYDAYIEKIIITEATRFWEQHILAKVPPLVDFEHPHAEELLKRLYNQVQDEMRIELDIEAEKWVQIWNESKEQASKYEKAASVAKAHLLDVMQNNNFGVLPNGDMLTRKIIKKKAFTVAESEYITLSHKRSKS